MNKNRQDIGEHLLLQYLQGNADKELNTAVEAWLAADSVHRKHLDTLEALWLETGRITPAPVAVDVEAAWEKVSTRMASPDLQGGTVRDNGKVVRMRSFRYFLSAAAMIIILVGMYGFYRLVIRPVKQTELASGMSVIHDTLPDGSRVTLNSNSKLVFSSKFQKGRREVSLSGEAFFEVQKDSGRPFVVNAGTAHVCVLGTSFRVKTNPDGARNPDVVVEVAVTVGHVLMFTINENTGDSASLLLNPGETGLLPAGATQPLRADSPASDGLFWANRSLDFRNTALSDVFNLMEKYFRVTITVSDPGMMHCRLTASFVDEPADRILEVIAGSFGFEVSGKGQNFHLTGHACEKDLH